MKVFNEEVEDCCLCPYLGNYSMNEEPYCKLDKKDIEDINVIPNHCPFSQKITKEVIEGFGFIKLQEYVLSHNGAYVLKTNLEYPEIGTAYKLDYLIESYNNSRFAIFKVKHIEGAVYENLVIDGILMFIGTINNPIELEFILRSIGVIE